ncbi:MAG: hypothetical protein M3498_01840 [Deinococcota bacterium]|nr:hypothetical protein [Deinococcota bacterium]
MSEKQAPCQHQVPDTEVGDMSVIPTENGQTQFYIGHNMDYESEETIDKEKSISTEFLLAEFNAMSEQWRHVDKRIENVINFYWAVWAVWAAFIPGAALLYQAFWPDSPLLSVVIFAVITFVIYVYSFFFFSAHRITSAAIQRARLLLVLNLIRLYFKNRDPQIAPYLVCAKFTPKPITGLTPQSTQIYPSFHHVLVYLIYITNSLLAAGASYAFFWQVIPSISLGTDYWLMAIAFIVPER